MRNYYNAEANLFSKKETFLKISLSALFFIYLIQLKSPLRLNADAINLLNLSQSITSSQETQFTHYPTGYPTFVAGLNRLGLRFPWVLVGVNLISLCVGLLILYRICFPEFRFEKWIQLLLLNMTLLSYIFVKHFPLPENEIFYFAFSMMTITVISNAGKFTNWNRIICYLSAFILIIITMSIRTAGIALLPTLVWAMANELKTFIQKTSLKTAHIFIFVLGSIFVGLFIICSLVIGNMKGKIPEGDVDTSYKQKFGSSHYGNLVIGSSAIRILTAVKIYKSFGEKGKLAVITKNKLTDLGELAVNIPASKSPIVSEKFFQIPGFLFLLLVGHGFWLRKKNIHPVDVYIISYVFIILSWPFRDARFWLPIFPLLMGWGALSLKSLSRHFLLRSMIKAHLLLFCSLGFCALVYTTRISFSGDQFYKFYGDGCLSPTYYKFFNHSELPGNGEINEDAIKILNAYYPTKQIS